MTGIAVLLLKENKINPFIILRQETDRTIYSISTHSTATGYVRLLGETGATRPSNRLILKIDSFMGFRQAMAELCRTQVANTIVILDSFTTISEWIMKELVGPSGPFMFQELSAYEKSEFNCHIRTLKSRDNDIVFICHTRKPYDNQGREIDDADPVARGLNHLPYFVDTEIHLYNEEPTYAPIDNLPHNRIGMRMLSPFRKHCHNLLYSEILEPFQNIDFVNPERTS